MVFCSICNVEAEVETDDQRGVSCCVECGSGMCSTPCCFSWNVTWVEKLGGTWTAEYQCLSCDG